MEDRELFHFGLKGMKWGIRRFQNEDGRLTPAGRARYGVGPAEGRPKTHSVFRISKELQSSLKSHNSLVKDSNKSLKQLKKDYEKGNISYKDYQKSLSDMYKNIKESGENLKNASLDSAKSVSITKTLAVTGAMTIAGLALDSASKKGSETTSMLMEYLGTLLIKIGTFGAIGGIVTKGLGESGTSLARTKADRYSERAGNRTVNKIEKAKYNAAAAAVNKAGADYNKAVDELESMYVSGQILSDADYQKKLEYKKRYEDAIERLMKQY